MNAKRSSGSRWLIELIEAGESMLRGVGIAGLCGLAAAPSVRADTIDATSTTIISGRQEPRDGQIFSVVPVYEGLSLIGDLKFKGVDEFKIVMSGWGSVAAGDPRMDRITGDRVTGDVDVGFVQATLGKQHVMLRLGRQMVTGGAARNSQIDGLNVTVNIFRGLGLSAYGGLPVTPRFGVHRGDVMFGSRVFYRYSINAEVAASFAQVNDQGRIARQDVALDARWVPYRLITFTGYALWSLAEQRLGEGDVAVSVQPDSILQISADFRRTSPDLFLPRNSILAVFSQETRDEAGAYVYVRPISQLRLAGDYHAVFNEAGLGHRGGGKITLSLGRLVQTSLGAEVRVLKLPANGYVQARLFLSERFGPSLFFTVDGNTYFLDQPINGQTLSLTGAATLGWQFTPSWQLALVGSGDVTPFVEHRFEAMARLSWNHSWHLHRVLQ